MRKGTGIVKRVLALFLVVLMSIESFCAVVGDNDGSAFITKAEFDSLKNNFQAQIDQYNTSIDSKIDGAIASYLAGVNVAKKGQRNSLSSGLFWSIGPFDRPRFKKGIPLYDFISSRELWKDNRNYGYVDGYRMIISWGNNFYNDVPIKNANWAYTDIVLTNTKSTNTTGVLDGIYNMSSHQMFKYNLNTMQDQWPDKYNEPLATGNRIYLGLAGNNNSDAAYAYVGFNARPFSPGYTMDSNPYVPGDNLYGNRSQAKLVKGKSLLWDDKIMAFGPISYHCFTPTLYNTNISNLGYTNVRDEICYVKIDSSFYNSTNRDPSITHYNFLRGTFPDVDNITSNPWNDNELTGWKSQVYAGFLKFNATSHTDESQNFYGVGTVDAVRGWSCGNANGYRINTDYVYLSEIPFSATDNWNKIGRNTDNAIIDSVSSLNRTDAIIVDENNNKTLSLAAGLPVFSLEKEQSVDITGTFRKNCGWSYNVSTEENTLNIGDIDETTEYVIYAKSQPFDVTKLPEEEYDDLIDISGESNDVANVGLLQKCKIVRDGKIKFTFKNESTKSCIVYLKWEKLSNWQTIGQVRKTGTATNTDINHYGSATGTMTPPTWTYFGGGYLKLDDSFQWVDDY